MPDGLVPGRHARAGAVVGHPDGQGLGLVAQADRRARLGPRVPQHVGQGLLQDPVGRVAHGRGERPRLALGGERDRGARGGHRLTQRGQPVQPGRTRLGGFIPGLVAQLAERGPHLGERRLARLPDSGKRAAQVAVGAAGLIPWPEHMQRRPGLHRDRGHAVRHGVVQFAGDPQSLLGDPAAGLRLPFFAGQAQPVRGLRGQRAPAADHFAQHDGQREHGDAGQELVGQRDQPLMGGHLHHEHADRHEEHGNGDRGGQVPGDRGIVQRQAEQRRGGDVPAVHDVVEQDQGRAAE